MFVHSTTSVVQYHKHPRENQHIQLMGSEESHVMQAIVTHTGCRQEEGKPGNEPTKYEPRTNNHKHHPNLAKILEERVDKNSHHQGKMKRGSALEEGENTIPNWNWNGGTKILVQNKEQNQGQAR